MKRTATRDDTVFATPVTPPIEQPQPATPAERQRAYRTRRKRAVTQAIGEESKASRVTLLALLASDLAMLEDETRKSMHTALRNSARRVLRTLVTRYEIALGDDT